MRTEDRLLRLLPCVAADADISKGVGQRGIVLQNCESETHNVKQSTLISDKRKEKPHEKIAKRIR